jgi:hypothetical protein
VPAQKTLPYPLSGGRRVADDRLKEQMIGIENADLVPVGGRRIFDIWLG